MKNKELIEYYKDKKTYLQSKIEEITRSLDYLPLKEQIVLPKGLKLEELKAEYCLSEHLTIRQRLLGISTNDLKSYLYKTQKQHLQDQIADLELQIAELNSVVIANEQITQISGSNKYIIATTLEFCAENKLSSRETLDIIIGIFKTPKTDKQSILSSLERDFLSQIEPDGTIKKENITNALFIFDKIFSLVLSSYPDHTLTINGLITELKLSATIGQKDLHLSQKKAISQLQEYIDGSKIVKVVPDINYFELLLTESGLDNEQISSYIAQMKSLKKAESELHTNSLISKHLSQSEYFTYLNAIKISSELTDEKKKNLIDRLIKDVTSMCRYLEMPIPREDTNETIEILATKIHLLGETIELIEKPTYEESTYQYIVGDDDIPVIIRNIEATDSTNYLSIYNCLLTLSNKIPTEPAFTINDINFYIEHTYETNIIYTIVNGKKVLISASNDKDIDIIKSQINQDTFRQITDMHEKTSKAHSVAQNYEHLLIKLLDLDNGVKDKTLKK